MKILCQKASDNKKIPGYPEGTPVVTTTDELKDALCPDRRSFLTELDLSPREIALHASSIARSGVSRSILKVLAIAEYAGVPLHEAFLTYNASPLRDEGFGSIEREIKKSRQYLRAIEPNAAAHAGYPVIEPFQGFIREIDRAFMPNTLGKLLLEHHHLLMLQLPEADMREVIRNSHDAPFYTTNAFAHLRFRVLKDFRIEVLDFRSDHHDYLKSVELKQRYKAWPHILMRGLLDYAAHTEAKHHDMLKEIEAPAKRKRTVEIIFPSVAQALQVHKAVEKSFNRFGTITVPNPEEPDKAHRCEPGLSEKEGALAFMRLPLQYGFLPASDDRFNELHPAGLPNETFHRPLTKTVNFIRSKQDQDPLFRFRKPSARLKKWLSMGTKYFSHVGFSVVSDQPYPLTHPVKPQAPSYLRRATTALLHGAEVCEALRLSEDKMPCATDAVLEGFESLRNQIPDYSVFRELVPDGFTLMSKGYDYGAERRWWRLPEQEAAGITAQVIHLKDQNRHPSLRLVSFDENGHPKLLGSYSFKGGGVATTEGVIVHQPRGRRLPIYYRRPDIVEKDGKKTIVQQFNGHDLWGGQSRSSSIAEFLMAGEIALFCREVNPKLLSGVAIPIAAERLLSMPTWKEQDGFQVTEWHDPIQYLDEFLPEYKSRAGLFQAVSYSRSDVRLSQLVGKTYNSLEGGFSSLAELEQQIQSALALLYLTHEKEFQPTATELIPNPGVGLREIANFLAEIGEANGEAAQQIYDEFEGRALGCLAALHGGDGHLGGVKKGAAGLMFGGPQSIRNIDLYGTMHDYDTSPFLPWSPHVSCNGICMLNDFSEIQFYQAADALLLKESLYWLRKSLFGLRTNEEIDLKRLPIDKRQDISVLQSSDAESLGLRQALIDLKAGKGPEVILGEERMVEVYREYRAKGDKLAEQYIDNPLRSRVDGFKPGRE